MDTACLSKIAGLIAKTDHESPSHLKPPGPGRRIAFIPEHIRGLWVLATKLKEVGYKKESDVLLATLMLEVVKPPNNVRMVIDLEDPDYAVCSDWGIYYIVSIKM